MKLFHHSKTVCLQIIPLQGQDIKPEKIEQWYEQLHGLLTHYLRRSKIELGIYASYDTGVIYYLNCTKKLARSVRHSLRSIAPGYELQKVSLLPEPLKVRRYWLHQTQGQLADIDSGINQLAGLHARLSNVTKNEIVHYNLQIRASWRSYREQYRVSSIGYFLMSIILLIIRIIFAIFDSLIGYHPVDYRPKSPSRPIQATNNFQGPFFITYTTVSVIGPRRQWRQTLQSAIAVLNNSQQSLKWRSWRPLRPLLFSGPELRCLFQLPTAQPELTKQLRSVGLAPDIMQRQSSHDVVLGVTNHQNSLELFGLHEDERHRHLYIVGGTGNGKTTMLLSSIVQDMRAGKGITVIDPHGDLVQTLLGYVPADRRDQVVYINPDDLARPIGVNLLEIKPGLSGDELLRARDSVTEATISVFRKVFSEDDSGGHRIEYVLRNAIHTALTTPSPTLFTVYEVLNNSSYRKRITNKLTDPHLITFWKEEFGQAGSFQRVKMTAGITSKIGRFLFSAPAERMLSQPISSFSFETAIAKQQIVLCNVSKGLLGEDTSTLLGTTLLAKLQLAALAQARKNEADRIAHYVYVDEFQNFATMSFVQLLSEARKYRLFVSMAQQSTAQQSQQRLVDAMLANVGTVVAFRTGSPLDERMLLPLFRPYLDTGALAHQPRYHCYIRVAATEPQSPASVYTQLLTSPPDLGRASEVVDLSRQVFGRTIRTSKTPTKQVLKTNPTPL